MGWTEKSQNNNEGVDLIEVGTSDRLLDDLCDLPLVGDLDYHEGVQLRARQSLGLDHVHVDLEATLLEPAVSFQLIQIFVDGRRHAEQTKLQLPTVRVQLQHSLWYAENSSKTTRRMQLAECNSPNATRRTQLAECNSPNATRRMQLAECNSPNATHRMQLAECNSPNATRRMQLAECNSPNATRRMRPVEIKGRKTGRKLTRRMIIKCSSLVK